MMKLVLPLFCFLLLATAGVAQIDKPKQGKGSTISDVDFFATNVGLFGLNTETKNSGFIVPRGSDKGYLFGSGLWFGAKKRVLDSLNNPIWRPLVFLAFNPNSSASWGTPGDGYLTQIPESLLARPDLYRSGDYNKLSGEPLVPAVPPEKTPNWPLWASRGEGPFPPTGYLPLDPGTFEQFDSIRTVGPYRPYIGPAFIQGTDEQFVSRFHDGNLTSYETNEFTVKEGYPIGLQVQQNIYAWKSGGYRHTVIIQYDIINMSNDTLRDCIAGHASDPDLGSFDNDRIEFYARRPELRVGYIWTDIDTTGEYDTLAVMMIEAPMVGPSGFIDNRRRREFKEQGRAGSFPHWTTSEDPHTSAERYAFMANGTFTGDQGADDQRAMMASRSFSMRPGDTAHFAIAYGVLDDTSSQPSSARLESWATSLADYYYYEPVASSVEPAVEPSTAGHALSVAPNPATGMARISFAVALRSEARLRVVNGLGQVMIERSLGVQAPGIHDELIDIGGLPPAAYLVVIQDGEGSRAARLNVVR